MDEKGIDDDIIKLFQQWCKQYDLLSARSAYELLDISDVIRDIKKIKACVSDTPVASVSYIVPWLHLGNDEDADELLTELVSNGIHQVFPDMWVAVNVTSYTIPKSSRRNSFIFILVSVTFSL